MLLHKCRGNASGVCGCVWEQDAVPMRLSQNWFPREACAERERMKKGEGWCVFMPCGWPVWQSGRIFRNECLREAEAIYGEPWRTLRLIGFTVRKVKLVEVSR